MSIARPVAPGLSGVFAAGPPSRGGSDPSKSPLPAKVVMIPAGEILRTLRFLESSAKTLPELSIARLVGVFSCALVAGPPSPEYPGLDVPASRVMMLERSNWKIEWRLVNKMFPFESTAMPEGGETEASAPRTGVGRGAPPTTVEITYS